MAPGRQSQNRSRMLSTGKAAQLLSVTPDTVLKWIKSGRLRATRTAGGHYRVAQNDLDQLAGEGRGPRPAVDGGFLYCWEYFASGGEPGQSCLSCLVYRARARRCYEMSDLGEEAGYSGAHCTNSCDECAYYHEVVGRPRRVLVVTESADLRSRLQQESSNSRIEVEFACSEYECSSACHAFKPEFVVIDSSLSKAVRASLCFHLAADPRIPGVQIILTSGADDIPQSDETGRRIDRAIPRTFKLAELEHHIIGLEVKQATRA
jgi:excisionase family DNA binding protein